MNATERGVRAVPLVTRLRKVPSPVRGTLRALVLALADSVGSNLVGVYLYGSLTQGAFVPARSDIDCVAVVRRDLTDAQFRRLGRLLARAAAVDPWIHRVQLQVLRRGRLLRSDTLGALYQFGVLSRSGSDGNPIIWHNVLASGLTLVGARPESFLPTISEDMIFCALLREVEYLRAEIGSPSSPWRRRQFYRAYAVLTLCRILYTHRTRNVASKPTAARWSLRTLPARWHSLIRSATASDRGQSRRLPLRGIARFIEFVDNDLKKVK